MAIDLHHQFQSRKLIESMHRQGYCIPYSELRQFLTSAALHVDSLQQQSEVGYYIPPEICPIQDGGQFICAAADNWDHNERTIDGKRTTHAMTSILIQQQSQRELQHSRIKRSPDRALQPDSLPGMKYLKLKILKHNC